MARRSGVASSSSFVRFACVAGLALAFAGSAAASDPDVCSEEGLSGAPLALCQVHCSVLDCANGGPERACERIASLFERRTGALPPCLDAGIDTDGDGVVDPLDNCPALANPGQEDTFGSVGIGDDCDCPCFTRDDALAIATDPLCAPVCIASRPTSLDLLALQCALDRPDDSVLVAIFTDFEGPLCQWNVPAPGESVLATGLPEGQETACRDFIQQAAAEAGLLCR